MDERVATASLPGRRKAAILLVSLGSKGAAEIFRHLPNEMIEQLTVEMAKMQAVEPAVRVGGDGGDGLDRRTPAATSPRAACASRARCSSSRSGRSAPARS